jgi:hypothetical protein
MNWYRLHYFDGLSGATHDVQAHSASDAVVCHERSRRGSIVNRVECIEAPTGSEGWARKMADAGVLDMADFHAQRLGYRNAKDALASMSDCGCTDGCKAWDCKNA